MAALVSPTPVPASSLGGEVRRVNRTTTRTAYSRPLAQRSLNIPAITKSKTNHQTSGDSSDDEDLAPIKLSAEARAILGEDNSNISSDKENVESVRSRKVLLNTLSDGNGGNLDRRFRSTTSPDQRDDSPARRVVRVTTTNKPAFPQVLGRDGSFMYKIHDKSFNVTTERTLQDSQTPGNRTRRVRVSGSRQMSRSPPSAMSPEVKSYDRRPEEAGQQQEVISPIEDDSKHSADEAVVPVGPSTIVRPRRAEEHGVHSTMRIKRVGAGGLLSRPVRRGMIRRQSEEDDEKQPEQEGREESQSPEIQVGRRAQEPDLDDIPDLFPASRGSPKPTSQSWDRNLGQSATLGYQLGSGFASQKASSVEPADLLNSGQKSNPTPAFNASHSSSKSTNSQRKPIFKLPSLPPQDPTQNQENEPPPTFKKTKPSAPLLEIREDLPANVEKAREPAEPILSPSRDPLAPRSENTPHRPAPAPPPKMSLIEAATSNAGVRNKKSVHVVLNGRTYRRLDCIGRGGSSRVFRIMAENYKIFALKRVNLEDADMASIAGYKGEIDLLRKLENVDRVIRLFDYEVNEEKGILNVMMELGESDFNKMLNEQLKAENAKFDITFTRHYWKEMLECVQAVHNHDIVHSDLKPANFLLVKGQLKLIDFGIANAIQDNTVNVHRENQIGTPNYMSPESLVCHTTGIAGVKLLKLGKPSDVWSLGCILYQMTYGQPPFAHITKPFERVMSIPNPKVEIQFPSTGVGGAVVPFGLIKTLRRCLTREQSLRPTIKELLSDADPFLNPVAISPDMLGRVISNVVSYCRKREEGMRVKGELIGEESSCLPKDEEMKSWPWAFYEKLKQAQEEGTAW